MDPILAALPASLLLLRQENTEDPLELTTRPLEMLQRILGSEIIQGCNALA